MSNREWQVSVVDDQLVADGAMVFDDGVLLVWRRQATATESSTMNHDLDNGFFYG